MHYMEMIKKFREDNKETNEFYRQFEKDRKFLQRSALKASELLSC